MFSFSLDFFHQIPVRILQTLLLGVSSNGRVFTNLCETYVTVLVRLPSVFLLFRAVTV